MSRGRWAKNQNDGIMTFDEIGRHLGMTQSTAQYLYERGMKKLMKLPRSHFADFEKAVGERRASLDYRESRKRVFQDEPIAVGE